MNDADSLLEADEIDGVLEADGPTQPVVVIEYPRKGLSWFWTMALVILIPIGGLLIYHRVVVERLRSQTLAAKRDLESWKERMRLEAVRQELVPASREVSPSSTSPPAVAAPVSTLPSPVPVAATPHPKTLTGPPITAPAEVVADRGPSPSVEAGVVRQTESAPPRASFTGDSAAVVSAPAPGPPSPVEAAVRPPADAPPSTRAPLSPAGNPVAVAQSPAIEPENGPATSVAPPSEPAAVKAETPLPSREEMDRVILEESHQKQEEIRHQVLDKAIEIRRLRVEERIRFQQDLREVLEKNGRKAGEAIDQLCVRYGYESDRRRVSLGARIWTASTAKPMALRAALIREKLDLPETAILNFISDGLYAQLHTPNGPRDSNEVRVRAAGILLKYCTVTAVEDANRPGGSVHEDNGAGNRRAGTPSPRTTNLARPR